MTSRTITGTRHNDPDDIEDPKRSGGATQLEWADLAVPRILMMETGMVRMWQDCIGNRRFQSCESGLLTEIYLVDVGLEDSEEVPAPSPGLQWAEQR